MYFKMALPAVTRAFFTNRNQIKQCMSEGFRNLSLGGRVHMRTQSLKCLKRTTSQSYAIHATVHRRSPLCRSCESNGHENSRATSNWTYAMGSVIAFSLFSKAEEDTRTDAQKKEDEIILLLKRAKLSMMRGQLHGANGFLHQAIALAHQSNNTQAIIYTYSLMANLAYVQGQLDNAEKLFKVAMSFMLSGGTPQDDNGVIEMSLKLATIYAGQEKNDLAEMGFQFCSESLETKLAKFKELPAVEQSEELRKETRLLLGLTLDSHARYMVAIHRLSQAVVDYKRALLICQEEQGETHPQVPVGQEEQGETHPQVLVGQEEQGETRPQVLVGQEEQGETRPQVLVVQEEQGETRPQVLVVQEEQGETRPQVLVVQEEQGETRPQVLVVQEEQGETRPQVLDVQEEQGERVLLLLVIKPTNVVLYANLMIELEACMATQLWVNSVYRRRLSTHPCGAPVLRVSEVEMLFHTFTTWGRPSKVQVPVAQGEVETQGLQLNDELGGYYGVEC
ncbi:tetratricopeptide repeat protein 19, mitochondrial-like isoform X3 [Oncorhynchus keta]|uniref:tetratricopeptide repeat protein 19, mitochondrial-like isoform X2 n=1 Tax=Oncorhynchus keta TaxID=8018 RepID=UPI00227A5956|nr:tetratricopeptide repeat protein 19, mitochondrial-like isoform X2 [Oncorhynchus keta]XP_052319176.1 tetratricopeptide repeat protein 19, mitochondrial-like isoform X3 [Oncorhynchus keta]